MLNQSGKISPNLVTLRVRVRERDNCWEIIASQHSTFVTCYLLTKPFRWNSTFCSNMKNSDGASKCHRDRSKWGRIERSLCWHGWEVESGALTSNIWLKLSGETESLPFPSTEVSKIIFCIKNASSPNRKVPKRYS